MLCICAKDIAFAAMLGKCFPFARVVVDYGFHADWDKRMGIIIVETVEVRVCAYFWVDIGL